jgi:rhodanese-related sulfurtransferase
MNVDVWKFAQDNIFLVAVALVSGGMLLWPLVRRGSAGPTVDAQQATLMINREDALVLDVRDAHDYGNGHIVNAKNIPLAQVESRLRDLEKHKKKPLIVHCNTGSAAARAVALLRQHGFEKVYNLSGGVAAWRQAGLPLTK